MSRILYNITNKKETSARW